jgi:hypothetical protein
MRTNLLRILTALLIAVCIAGCEFSLSRLPLFKDNFEDGDLSIPPPGWGDPGGIYDSKTTYKHPISENQTLDLWGPLEGYDQQARNGLYHFLVGDEADGGIRPNAISYDIFPHFSTYSDTLDIVEGRVGYFDLMGLVPGDPFLKAGISLHFLNRYVEYEAMLVLRSGSGLTEYGPYGPMGLHHVEIVNIDWDASPKPRFDLYMNGKLLGACMEFIQPVASFTQFDVYNIHRGRVYYDNILMVVDEVIPCLPEPPPPPEPPALPPVSITPTPSPSPTATPTPRATSTETPTPTPADLIVTALQNLNCRAGTTTQFDVLHILMQGETARVLAMNQARTWSYLEIPDKDLRCWAWRGLLEDTQGDPNRAPVTAEPNTPTPSPTSLACAADLPEDLCVESGGSWDSEAVGAPSCICP